MVETTLGILEILICIIGFGFIGGSLADKALDRIFSEK